MCAVQNMKDEMEKQELMRRVEEKNEKTQAIEEQRLALQAELSATLRDIAASDAWLRVYLRISSSLRLIAENIPGLFRWVTLRKATASTG